MASFQNMQGSFNGHDVDLSLGYGSAPAAPAASPQTADNSLLFPSPAAPAPVPGTFNHFYPPPNPAGAPLTAYGSFLDSPAAATHPPPQFDPFAFPAGTAATTAPPAYATYAIPPPGPAGPADDAAPAPVPELAPAPVAAPVGSSIGPSTKSWALAGKKKPGRKPKADPPEGEDSATTRRQASNRKAQRQWRSKKEQELVDFRQRIEQLEKQLKEQSLETVHGRAHIRDLEEARRQDQARIQMLEDLALHRLQRIADLEAQLGQLNL